MLRHRAPADDPAHRGITPEAVRIVHVLVPGEAAEHGLAELREQRVTSVLPGALHVIATFVVKEPQVEAVDALYDSLLLGSCGSET